MSCLRVSGCLLAVALVISLGAWLLLNHLDCNAACALVCVCVQHHDDGGAPEVPAEEVSSGV